MNIIDLIVSYIQKGIDLFDTDTGAVGSKVLELFNLIPDWLKAVMGITLFFLGIFALIWLIKNRNEWRKRVP